MIALDLARFTDELLAKLGVIFTQHPDGPPSPDVGAATRIDRALDELVGNAIALRAVTQHGGVIGVNIVARDAIELRRELDTAIALGGSVFTEGGWHIHVSQDDDLRVSEIGIYRRVCTLSERFT